VKVALLSRSVHPLHAPGGMERAVHHLAKSLRARGAETFLVTRPALHDLPFPAEVLTVPWGGGASGHGRVLDRVRRYPRFSRRVGEVAARLVRERAVEVVDAQGLAALGYARLRHADRTLAPLVMNPQGMEEHRTSGLKRLALLPLRRLSREAARLADRVVATDAATRGDVTRLLGVDPARVSVIPNGIDPAEMQAATPRDPRAVAIAAVPQLAQASLVFLSVGRLERYKGFLDVQAALRLAAERAGALPTDWAWVVVGTGPDRALLEHSSLRGRVHVLEHASDTLLHALYAVADVFVHAPHFEGSSLVTLEAMAHALPVVATRAGGIPDKVVEGQTGFLVPPRDQAALADAIVRMAAVGESRRALGARGRERALALFSWDAIVGRVLELYAELRR
jgi:glycogen(starch) synthase